MTDSEGADPKLGIIPKGPVKAEHLKRLVNSRGETIAVGKRAVLCRCGASSNKPFCDGAHMTAGFTDEKSEDRQPDRRATYAGKRITIHDNRGICSHAGFCTGGLPAVFRPGTEPWIDPDGADVESVIRTIEKCPSGALSYTIDDVEHRDREVDPEVRVTKNGPYRVQGGVELAGHEWGEGASREHYALCRCGKSGNKPLCDGSHWYAAFKDDEGRTISAANRAVPAAEPVWHRVAGLDELTDGSMKLVQAGPLPILLTRVDGKYGALDPKCPHQGGPLDEGGLEDGAVACPWHGHRFDALTGKGVGRDTEVPTHGCEERKDGVYVAVEAATESAWTVSHLMVETMVNWGVTHVFGMVGHSNLGVAEAIRVQEEKGRLTYIGIRHEGAASFACSGFAKVSGRPAACLAIAGPGATNLLTGLWDAKVDRAPVLALTGQVGTQVLGPGAFQEIDLASAFEAVSAFSQTVLPDSDHAGLMTLALKNALVNRDVANLIFPDEVQTLDAGEVGPSGPEGRMTGTAVTPPEQDLGLAMYRLWHAERPVIIVGHGSKDGIGDVVALAEKMGAPILTTFKAKGLVPDDHPLAGGVLGRSGTPVASHFMDRADLLVVFGASFANHTGIARNKPIIQVDFDRMALGKFHAVDTPIWGDVGITARLMAERLGEGSTVCGDCADEMAGRRDAWQNEKKRRADQDRGAGIASAAVFESLTRLVPDDAVMPVDVGNNTYSFGRYFECARQTVIMSGYLGSIGFAFPAALGAWAAAPGRKVVSVSGDGGFGQYMAEFTTAVKYGMDITHVLLSNGELGKISKEQRDGGWPVWQTSLQNPDFARYAENCGGLGLRVEHRKDLDKALETAIQHEGPALVEVLTDPLLT